MVNNRIIAIIAVTISLVALAAATAYAQTNCLNYGTLSNCNDIYGNSTTMYNLGQGMTTWNDNDGNSGMIMDLGSGMATWNDSRGNSGTGMDLGGGMWSFSDSRGNTSTCMEIGGGIINCN